LSRREHLIRSDRAASRVARLAAFKSGSRVALYLPFDGEMTPRALARAAEKRKIRIFVPVVSDLRHRRLRFHPLSARTRVGRFGISIPHRSGIPLSPRWFDLIVVPLVGVDRSGRRLGMGGGFYDRAFAFRHARRVWRGPRLVGLGFEHQHVDEVFAANWDLRLDCLATESGIHHFKETPP